MITPGAGSVVGRSIMSGVSGRAGASTAGVGSLLGRARCIHHARVIPACSAPPMPRRTEIYVAPLRRSHRGRNGAALMLSLRSAGRIAAVTVLLLLATLYIPLARVAQAAPSVSPSASVAPATGVVTPDDPRVSAVVAEMSTEQKIGQLLWTHVYGTSADDTTYASANEAVFGEGIRTPSQAVEKYDLGGVIYFNWSHNVESPAQLAALSDGLQRAALSSGTTTNSPTSSAAISSVSPAPTSSASPAPTSSTSPAPTSSTSAAPISPTTSTPQPTALPLAIGMDQEGGLVARLRQGATDWPGAMALGATGSTELSYREGVALGEELRAVGVNVDFAPVLDVNTSAANPVIGVRSFGDDPEQVGALGVAHIRGLQEQGVAATAKHFPGHGDTHLDSHLSLPRVSYGRATLDRHLAPFRAAIDAGVDMIMTAHVVVDAVDPEKPATLSSKVLTGLLREELGYQGLIVTDALDMEGAELSVLSPEQQEQYQAHKLDRQRMMAEAGEDPTRAAQAAANPTPEYKAFMAPIRGEVALRALQAGADVLVNTYDPQTIVDHIQTALRTGALSHNRLDDAVRHVVAWKLTRALSAAALGTRAGAASSLPAAAPGSGAGEGTLHSSTQQDLSVVGSTEHQALASDIARASVTLLRNTATPAVHPTTLAGGVDATRAGLFPSAGILPISAEHYPTVAVIGPSYANPEFMETALTERGFQVTRDALKSAAQITPEEREQAIRHAEQADLVIVTSLSVAPNSAQVELMRQVAQTGKPWILVGARTPYDLAQYAASVGISEELLPEAALMLYSNRLVSYEAAVETILGTAPQGTLPVSVPWGDDASQAAFARGFGLTYETLTDGTTPSGEGEAETPPLPNDQPQKDGEAQPDGQPQEASQSPARSALAQTGSPTLWWLILSLAVVTTGSAVVYLRHRYQR